METDDRTRLIRWEASARRFRCEGCGAVYEPVAPDLLVGDAFLAAERRIASEHQGCRVALGGRAVLAQHEAAVEAGAEVARLREENARFKAVAVRESERAAKYGERCSLAFGTLSAVCHECGIVEPLPSGVRQTADLVAAEVRRLREENARLAESLAVSRAEALQMIENLEPLRRTVEATPEGYAGVGQLVVSLAVRVIERLTRERDEWRAKAERLEAAARSILRYISSHQVYDKDAEGLLRAALGDERDEAEGGRTGEL